MATAPIRRSTRRCRHYVNLLNLGDAKLCLTDPPYGVNLSTASHRYRRQRAAYLNNPIINDNLTCLTPLLVDALGGVMTSLGGVSC